MTLIHIFHRGRGGTPERSLSPATFAFPTGLTQGGATARYQRPHARATRARMHSNAEVRLQSEPRVQRLARRYFFPPLFSSHQSLGIDDKSLWSRCDSGLILTLRILHPQHRQTSPDGAFVLISEPPRRRRICVSLSSI